MARQIMTSSLLIRTRNPLKITSLCYLGMTLKDVQCNELGRG